MTKKNINFDDIKCDEKQLTQLIIDPTSLNLQKHVDISDPIVPTVFKLTRNLCNAIHLERTRILRELTKKI